jgi:hypothetical protein
MGLPKNRTNNPAGRPKGTRNRTTKETKDVVNSILKTNFSAAKVSQDLKKLEPRNRLDVLIKLLNFILPRPLNELENLTDERRKS